MIYEPNDSWEILGGFSYQYSGTFPKTNDLKLPLNQDFYKPFSTKRPAPDPNFGFFGYNPLRFQNTSGFLQTTFKYERTSVVAGARYDEHSLYGKSINPRIAVIQKLGKNSSLRASYTEGFRGPPIYDLYNSIATGTIEDGVFYLAVPSPDLKPEKLRSYELGFRSSFWKRLSLEIIGFHNYTTNRFSNIAVRRDPVLYPNSTQDKVSSTGNIGNSTLNGLDIIVEIPNIYKPYELSLTISNSFAKGTELFPSQAEGDQTDLEVAILDAIYENRNQIDTYRTVPNRMTKVRVSWKLWRKWFFAFDYTNSDPWYSRSIRTQQQYKEAEFNATYNPYFIKRRVDGFNIVDFNTYFQFTSYFRLIGKVTNLTNSIYSGKGAYESSDNMEINPQFRRSFYLGMEVNYKF
ncbi:MAG: TonB-dependent receptor [Spirochaetota bacterium]